MASTIVHKCDVCGKTVENNYPYNQTLPPGWFMPMIRANKFLICDCCKDKKLKLSLSKD